MPSINLLPKDIGAQGNGGGEKASIVALSFFLMLVTIVSYSAIYLSKTNNSNTSKLLDVEIQKTNDQIEEEYNNNKLFSMEGSAKDAEALLKEHYYFSKALKMLQMIITDDVYLTKSDLLLSEDGNLVFNIEGIAKNYLAAINQIAVFKDSYWVYDAKVGDIKNTENNEAIFSGKLTANKDLILYHENYWEFGLALLSSKTNRDLRVDKYDAVLKETENIGNIVDVEFSGVSYNEEKLLLLENDLKQMNLFVKEVSISYDLDDLSEKGEAQNTIEFKGKMKLNY